MLQMASFASFIGCVTFHGIHVPHLCIHSSVGGRLGCLHILAVVNSAARNIEVQVSFQIIVLFGCVPRSGTAGSCASSIFSF